MLQHKIKNVWDKVPSLELTYLINYNIHIKDGDRIRYFMLDLCYNLFVNFLLSSLKKTFEREMT